MNPLDQRVKIAAHQAQSGRLDLAVPALQAIIQQDPQHAEALRTLAMAIFQSGQQPQGIALMRRAGAAAAERADLQFMLGSMLAWTGQLGEAVPALKKSIELDPAQAQPHALLATCLLQMGDSDSAEDAYRAAIGLDPKHPEARTNYATILNSTARSAEAVRILREAAKDHPNHPGLLTNYCVALNYADTVDAAEILEAHKQYGRAISALPNTARTPLHTNRDPDKRLRIGILSPDLFEHSVGYFVRAMIENSDPAQTEWFAYATGGRGDTQTQRIKAAVGGDSHWRAIPPRTPDANLVDLIRSDRIDILLELSGHTHGHRQPALRMRAAPVQVTAIGYPNTTGNPAIDYRLVDSITDPPAPPHEADARATEKLIRLDPCFLCYTPPEDAPNLSPPPHLENSHITFGSFNSVKKITPTTCALWAAALHAVPTSRLIIKSGGFSSKRARQQVTGMLKHEGLPEVRFDLLDRIESKSGHLGAYSLIDIALDTFPYHGTTTTCEAMWMGLPVVTLEGTLHASRVGSSLLTAVGLPDLIAKSQLEFASIARALAENPARLTLLRDPAAGLRAQMSNSPLLSRAAFSARFHTALREIWRQHSTTV